MAFNGAPELKKFEKKVWLSSPTMHGDELKWMQDAFEKNWMTTAGENINVLEKIIAEKVGVKYAVALSSGTAALHLSMKIQHYHNYYEVFQANHMLLYCLYSYSLLLCIMTLYRYIQMILAF